ncbi:hypothetical protein AAVH_37788, partial [Aphelenchoides avenae]
AARSIRRRRRAPWSVCRTSWTTSRRRQARQRRSRLSRASFWRRSRWTRRRTARATSEGLRTPS